MMNEIQTKRIIELNPGDHAIVVRMNETDFGPVQAEVYAWDGTHGELDGFTLTASSLDDCHGLGTAGSGRDREYGSAEKGMQAALRSASVALISQWVQFVKRHTGPAQ